MNEDKTIPAALMSRDFLPQEKQSGGGYPIWKILLGATGLLLLLLLFKR